MNRRTQVTQYNTMYLCVQSYSLAFDSHTGMETRRFKFREVRDTDREEQDEDDESKRGSSDFEADYLLSNTAGDDHLLSSLPDEAKDDFLQPLSSDDKDLEDASVQSLQDVMEGMRQRMANQEETKDESEGGAEADDGRSSGMVDGSALDAELGADSGGGRQLVKEVDILNQQLLNASRVGDVALIRKLVTRSLYSLARVAPCLSCCA
jgi:hypothetical protein